MLDDYASLQLRFWFHDNLHKVLAPDSKERRLWQRILAPLWDAVSLVAAVCVPSIVTLLLLHAVTRRHLEIDLWQEGQKVTFGRTFSLLRWEGHCILLTLISWVLLLDRLLPGQRYEGPPANNGVRPAYKRNGFAFFLLTTALTAAWGFVAGPTMFHLLPTVASSVGVFSLGASLFAYVKGRVAPNTSESARFTRNWMRDILDGVELYPCSGDLQLKQILVRTGAVIDLLILFVALVNNLDGRSAVPYLTTVAIFSVNYLHRARRYWHEECYSHAFEATGHNLGLGHLLRHLLLRPFLLNVGTLSAGSKVLPSASLSPRHSVYLALISLMATSAVVLTYLIDRQKFLVKCKRGKCQTWGRLAETINAFYVDNNDIRRSSTILCSGYWGLARHLNYTGEMLTYGLLALPGLLFHGDPFAVVPFLYITAVLTFRTREDFKKCRKKYGPYWSIYCERVPFTFIPGLV